MKKKKNDESKGDNNNEEFLKKLEELTGKKTKFDMERVVKAQFENKEEFKALELELFNLAVAFSFRALKTFQVGQKETLNRLQINQIVHHELDAIINDLADLEKREVIIKKAEKDFYDGKSKPLIL